MRHRRQPGALLVRPAPLVALTLVVVNDHLLKAVWPGLVTGKLSDLAGAFLLPVLILAVGEMLASRRRQRLASTRTTTAVCLAECAGLGLVKIWPAASRGYGTIVGLARYPLLHRVSRVQVATDPTDLVALVSVALAWCYVCGSGRRPGSRAAGTRSITAPFARSNGRHR